MPFPVHRTRVSRLAQQVPEGLLPPHETPASRGSDRHAVGAGADWVASGHQRRAGWRALRFRGIVRQTEPLLGERVDPVCPGAAKRTAAVTAQLTEAEVVDMEEEDVRQPAGAVGLVGLIDALARHSRSPITPSSR
jgi:hypothetical protein